MRVCTWNILLGLRLEKVISAVQTAPDFHGLDVLALQEASMHDGRHDAEAVAQAMGGGYDWFQATAQLFRGREQGNALIWRRGLFDSAPQKAKSRRCQRYELATRNLGHDIAKSFNFFRLVPGGLVNHKS